MSKYSTQFKLKVIRHYQAGTEGYHASAHRFGLDAAAVRKWVAAYQQHGKAGIAPGYRRYDQAFKLAVLRAIQSQAMSVRGACAHFNIPTASTVLTWQRLYNDGGASALIERPRGRPRSMPTAKPKPTPPVTKPVAAMTPEEMQRELRYLRAENAYLKKLDALIQNRKSAPKTKR